MSLLLDRTLRAALGIGRRPRPGAAPRWLASSDVVDGAPLFPGFRLPVADVFA